MAPSAAGLTVRDARPSDLEAVVAIYNDAVPSRTATADLEPVNVESRRPWLESHLRGRRPLLVAERDGAVVGWLSFSDFYGRPAYHATAELGVYVDARARRTGVGRTLLGQALAGAPGLGVDTLLALVFAHNEPSLRLFAQAGFEPWGLLPRVADLGGRRCDLSILGRHVVP